jgi:hypothetical protein
MPKVKIGLIEIMFVADPKFDSGIVSHCEVRRACDAISVAYWQDLLRLLIFRGGIQPAFMSLS